VLLIDNGENTKCFLKIEDTLQNESKELTTAIPKTAKQMGKLFKYWRNNETRESTPRTTDVALPKR